jgi:diguanylate cyclase (GGDEF)-like protein/PAS domain S-box-containing protein
MSLSLRISFIIGVIAIAISSAVAYVHFQFQLEHFTQQSENLVTQMAENDRGTSSIAAYLLDMELAEEIVAGLANNDLIAFASISSRGEPVAAAGRNTAARNNLEISLHNPFDGTEQIGLLVVHPDAAFIQNQASSNSIQTALTLIGLSIVIAIIVGVFVNLKLTRPLRALSREFARVDTSNPEKMIAIDIGYRKHDEISRLIKKTNNLISALQARFRSEKILRQTNDELQKQFRLLFEQATAGIALISDRGQVSIANPAFKALFGALASKTDFSQLFDEPDKVSEQLNTLRNTDSISQIDIDFVSVKDGQKRYLHCLFSSILDSRELARDNSQNLIEVIVYDVTERREDELKARYEADHDSLTGLLNRRSGLIRLQSQFNQSLKNNKVFSLMMIDLDNFKPVNDTYGHDAGDIVLQTISRRVKSLMNDTHSTFIRWGGDEFLLGLTIEDTHSITEFADSLLNIIRQDVALNQAITVQVGASIGIIRVLKRAPLKVDELIMKADELMYDIKQSGRNHFQITTLL